FTLRYYQREAADATMAALSRRKNPVVTLPTGSGKSATAAEIVFRVISQSPQGARIVVVAPSRELVQQDEAALLRYFQPEHVGVVCASLNRREGDRQILVGTPQSLAGTIDFDPAVVVVDEAHLMPLHKKSWFARLFAGLPRRRRTPRAGLTATSFRTADGAIFGPGGWFNYQAYEISARELIARGYLAPMRYIEPAALMTVEGVAVTAGDFNQGQLVTANIDRVAAQVELILKAMEGRDRAMIFAVTVEHARAFQQAFADNGERCELIIGDMSANDRTAAVDAFKSRQSRIAVTVAAALTGFDVPEIDLIASCRPTKSAIIHTQSIGRGTRVAKGKSDCIVLDFAGNVRRFGPIISPNFDASGQSRLSTAPWRPCPSCGTFAREEAWTCQHCGERLRGRAPREKAPLEITPINFRRAAKAVEKLVRQQGLCHHVVHDFALEGHEKRDHPGSFSVRLKFDLGGHAIVYQWEKDLTSDRWARIWWAFCGDDPAPHSFEEAFGRRHELVRPLVVSIERDGPFWRVVSLRHRERAAA
ncbi:MAG: DEAD/DEAH box helicase, partial [Rhizobiaceae bacterium]